MDHAIDESDRKLKYDFDYLEGIIFGIKTPIKEKLKTIEIIKNKCQKHERTNFEFYQAYYCPDEKIISYRDMNIKIDIPITKQKFTNLYEKFFFHKEETRKLESEISQLNKIIKSDS